MGAIAERLARVEEAYVYAQQDRAEAHQDRKDLLAEVKDMRLEINAIRQTLTSTQNTINTMALEKAGERLAVHDRILEGIEFRLKAVEDRTASLPKLEADLTFWRRVIGSGVHAVWRLALFALSSGGIGAILTKLLWH